jgi:D-alanyl-D-alanine carboxypeptidase
MKGSAKLICLLSLVILTSVSSSQTNFRSQNTNKKITSKLKISEISQYKKDRENWGKISDNDFSDVELAEKLQFTLDSIMAKRNLIGASACVKIPEIGIWRGVYGTSHSEIPVHSEMLFAIGSNTKTFTSALILLLAEEGLLSLEDQLHQWLPTFPNIDSTVTIRQLLNHSSGISDYTSNSAGSPWEDSLRQDLSRYWSPEYILTFVGPPVFSPPGTSWKYSSTNSILAGMIIREATGNDTVALALHKKLLDQMNLNNTYMLVEEDPDGVIAHAWLDWDGDRHRDDVSLLPQTAYYSSMWTAGGMVSTAEDMAIWVHALYRGDLLGPTSLQEMQTYIPINIWGPSFVGYGLGTVQWILQGDTLFAHGGHAFGNNSEAAYWPERDISYAVLMNQDTWDTYPDLLSEIIITEFHRVVIDYITDIPLDDTQTPVRYSLNQNYPNPFNPSTTIEFTLPKSEFVELKVFNILGKEVSTVVSNKLNQGNHTYQFDGKNLASGIYYYQLVAGEYREVKKMILLR